jgi:predicted sugar kinase
LHFGLLSFGGSGTRQFGGVGAMVDAPGLAICFRPAERFSATGPLAERALLFAHEFAHHRSAAETPSCQIEIESAPAEHVGLGTGTQLGLAVAAGLSALRGELADDGSISTNDATGWARLVGRGHRSAIGTLGFAHGGLLVEAGKRTPEAVSPLVSRLELPTALCREILVELLPAAAEGDFDAFAESLFRYGREAGALFAQRQGGPYAAGFESELVDWLRGCGVHGVGQSSWGPTIFALARNRAEAESLVIDARAHFAARELTAIVAAPSNRGARVERC